MVLQDGQNLVLEVLHYPTTIPGSPERMLDDCHEKLHCQSRGNHGETWSGHSALLV